MGNQRTSGLTKRGGIWHIDKTFRGARICESTGTSDLRQAQEYLAKRVIELRETRALRRARTSLVPVRGDEIPAGIWLQEAHQGRRAALEAARCLHRRDGAETSAHGKPAGVHRAAAAGWRQDQDSEPGARRRAQGPKSCRLRVDGSTRQNLAGNGTEDQAVFSQGRPAALSARPARNRRSCFRSCPTISLAWRSSR